MKTILGDTRPCLKAGSSKMTNQKHDSGVYHDECAFPQLILNVLYIEIIEKVSSLDPGRKSSDMWGTQHSRKAVLRKLPLVPLHQRIPQHALGETGLRVNFLGLLKMPCSKRLTPKTQPHLSHSPLIKRGQVSSKGKLITIATKMILRK